MTDLETVRAQEIEEIDTDPENIDEQGLEDLLDAMKQMALDMEGGPAQAVAEGTFALYPMTDGGFMFVTAVDRGPMAGIKHTRIRPALIRAIAVIVGGGSKRAAIKAMFRR